MSINFEFKVPDNMNNKPKNNVIFRGEKCYFWIMIHIVCSEVVSKKRSLKCLRRNILP